MLTFHCNAETLFQRVLQKQCNQQQPGFFGEKTKNALAGLASSMKVQLTTDKNDANGFQKCHVIPFTFIRRKVCNRFDNRSDSKIFENFVQNWQIDLSTLNDKLHAIDNEWYDFVRLQKNFPNVMKTYIIENTNNKKKCKDLITATAPSLADETFAKNVWSIVTCMNDAPANLRPGYAATNQRIGEYFDPMLNQRVAKGRKIVRTDLTKSSIAIKEYLETKGRCYKKNGGIISSDQAWSGDMSDEPESNVNCAE